METSSGTLCHGTDAGLFLLQVCLNTLSGLLPHRTLEKKVPISSVLWYAPMQSLLTGGKDELCITQMTRHEDGKAAITTHRQPLSCLHYLAKQGQLLTACKGGIINSWDLRTGQHLMQFSSALGDAAVTCLASNSSGLRILSAVGGCGAEAEAAGWAQGLDFLLAGVSEGRHG